jgi:hypothetical protein
MRKELMTIRGGFRAYRGDVIPDEANDMQVLECKRAFYAGAWLMFSRMMSITDLTEEEADAKITQLCNEVQSFADSQ